MRQPRRLQYGGGNIVHTGKKRETLVITSFLMESESNAKRIEHGPLAFSIRRRADRSLVEVNGLEWMVAAG